MHFGLREIAAAISVAALFFCCSCEKHRLGEDPEVQKEKVDEVKSVEENAPPAAEGSTSNPSPARTSPTPVEFFPESTPTP